MEKQVQESATYVATEIKRQLEAINIAKEIKRQFATIIERKWKQVENLKRLVEMSTGLDFNKDLQEATTEWCALLSAYHEIFGEVV